MENTKKLNKWFLILVAIFQFPLKLAGSLHYLTYIYLYLISLIYVFANYKYLVKNKTDKFQIFKLVYIYLFFVAIIWPIINGTFDFSYVSEYCTDAFLWVIKYSFLVIIFIKYVLKDNPFEEFAEYFIRGAGIYAFVSLLFALIKPLREIAMNIFYLTEADRTNMLRGEYVTRFGWTGWSTFNETYVCTIAVILGCIIIYNSDNWNKRKQYLKIIVLPLVGNAMFGRIGLLVSVLCIAISIFLIVIKGNVKILLLSLAACALAVAMFFLLKNKTSVLNTWYEWVFSAFRNYQTMGKFYDDMGTIEHLSKDMYWMPKTSTFLLGDGRYTNPDGSYYMHTDPGVMRQILYYGVFHYMLSIVGMLLLINQFARESICCTERKRIIIVYILLLLALVVFELKGETIWMLLGILMPFVSMLNYCRQSC